MAEVGFSKDELSFAEELPKHVEIECPVCLQVMLDDPHLVTCCGHHFCGACIQRIIASNGPCPMCKEKNYHAVIDWNTYRVINGLQVYCTNTRGGCQWKRELKNLLTHLSKGKREGECQYEETKCRYEECKKKRQRRHLDDHEKNDCPQRPYHCKYCRVKGTYLFITNEHYNNCLQFPVACPNMCQLHCQEFPRSDLNTHLSEECPLQPVQCMFSWAGCTDTPLRKDSQSHTTDPKHMSLLAATCGQLKSENEKLASTCQKLAVVCEQLNEKISVASCKLNEKLTITCDELKSDNEKLAIACCKFKNENKKITSLCSELKKENEKNKEDNLALWKEENKKITATCEKLTKENDALKEQMQTVYNAITTSYYPTLPITIKLASAPVHVYTHIFGHHISVLYHGAYPCSHLYLAFHVGDFDKLQPKLPKISVKDGSLLTPIITDTSAKYEKLTRDILIKYRHSPFVLSVNLGSLMSQHVEILAISD